ncbi:MAG: diacylglycerol kinase family lipid kinase [Clostridia bacterium]|nr:diacylglycerol kinase family lipid kinase [Clostridia bacterium]
MKKVLIIFNPRAGKNSSRKTQDDIIRTFKDYGFFVTEKVTTCVGDATEIVKHNVDSHDLVVCCGGDGTFNEAVNGMVSAETTVPLMYLPMGTTNDLANTIGVTKDLKSQIELYLKGSIHSYDIGKFNDRHFTYVASFGVGADASYNTSQKWKNRLGYLAYLLNGFVFGLPHQIKNLKPHHMIVETDEGIIDDNFYFGAVSNSNEVGGIFKFNKKEIKLNDGVFEVIFVKKVRGVLDAFRLLKKIKDENYDGSQIINFKTTWAKITSDEELPWTLDGEFGGAHNNVEIGLLHDRVNLVSPPSKYFVSEEKEEKEEETEEVFAEEMAEIK